MEFLKELIDKTSYLWWKDNESTLEKDAPFYCTRIPDTKTIQESGCNCAGLINMLHVSRGLTVPGVISKEQYAGGTYIWFKYLKRAKLLEPIDVEKSYPAGSLLIRKYRNSVDQGHLAILYSSGPLLEQKLLHCYPEKGITIDDSVTTSHNWLKKGYYEFICINWFHRELPASKF